MQVALNIQFPFEENTSPIQKLIFNDNWGNNRSFFRESYETRKYIVRKMYSRWLLKCGTYSYHWTLKN
jgi:hypothetical protein